MYDLKKLRILVDYHSTLRKFCKLTFTNIDSSIYVFPYSTNRRFYCGGSKIQEKQIKDTASYGFSSPTEIEPKLSIHKSGQIHIKNQFDDLIGPCKIPELSTLRGEHIATVCADSFDGLPLYNKEPVDKKTELDHVIPIENGVHSGCLALYLNGEQRIFKGGRCRLRIRVSPNKEIYLGVKTIPQLKLNHEIKPGVTVLSGWNPTLGPDAEQDYLYIRGL